MKSLFTLFLALLSTPLFAQYQVRSATLTDRNDKVLSGFIRYYDWDQNPEFIEFANDTLGVIKSLPLRDIQKLVVKDGPLYEGLYLKVPYYVKNPIALGEPIIRRTDSTYYLAELLLDSEAIKLYRFIDNDKNPRFVILKYDSLIMLENIDVFIIKNATTYSYKDPVFRKTLLAILSECPTLNTDNTIYTESSLIELLKQYLSFCRIDSKIYLEQKKIDKALIGLGALGAYWPSSDGNAQIYGVTVQVLLPRRFHNIFVMMEVGGISKNISEKGLQIGIYGGRYFGRRAIQGKIYAGLSTVYPLLDIGIGLSYKKLISIEVHDTLLGIFSGFRDGSNGYLLPIINLRAIFPLSRLAN